VAAAVIGANHRALLISLKLALCAVADKSAPALPSASAPRGPGESCSDVISRLAGEDA
jgi:hypothetical protein